MREGVRAFLRGEALLGKRRQYFRIEMLSGCGLSQREPRS
jgi:hypothetical protein